MGEKIFCSDKPWLKFYDKQVPEHIQYKEITLHQMLKNTVQEYPSKKALIFEGYSITFTELLSMAQSFACDRNDSVTALNSSARSHWTQWPVLANS